MSCFICSSWPEAERAERRREYLSGDYVQMPIKGVCEFCLGAFFETIAVVVDGPEELEASQEAARQDRSKGSYRPYALLLREIGNKRVKP